MPTRSSHSTTRRSTWTRALAFAPRLAPRRPQRGAAADAEGTSSATWRPPSTHDFASRLAPLRPQQPATADTEDGSASTLRSRSTRDFASLLAPLRPERGAATDARSTSSATRRPRASHALVFASLLAALSLGAMPAAADEPAPVTVAVRAPDAVDPEALRRSLARDLGVRVEVVRPDADARVIVEMTPDGLVRLRVRRDGQAPLTRETEAAGDRAETTVTVSLLVSNLVRDESAELLATLRITAPETTADAEAPPLMVPVPAQTPPDVIVVPAPEAESAPAPTEPSPTEPSPTEPSPTEPTLADVPVALDFAPMVGFSSGFAGGDRRVFSLGVLGALEGELDGLGMSGLVDVSLGDTNGVQLAGLASIGGQLSGAQLAGLVSVAGGDANGAQLSGVTSVAGRLGGVQLSGLVSVAARDAGGAQLSGLVSATPGRLSGLQLSGVASVAGAVDGLQVSGVASVSAGSMSGAQLGLVNVAGAVEGAQLGLVNVAGRVRGVQIGLFNVAEKADAAIGLFSLQTHGRTHLRVGGDTNGLLGVSLVHGGVTHSILSAAVMPFDGRPTFALGVGLGARAQLADIVHLDVEGLVHALLDDRVSQYGPGLMTELRVLAGVTLLDGVAVYAGLAYRIQITRAATPELGAPLLAHDLGVGVRGFPALVAGVELFR